MYNPDNIFAKIIRGEIPASKVYEDAQIIAIHDLYPVAPIHILVIPKGDYIDFNDFLARASTEEVKKYFLKVSEIAENETSGSYRVVTNIGRQAGQTIFHFHTHIISGKELKNIAG